ncbi:hypothetical protein [Cytobacillus purgationiresistens]|uniref:Uncharacterized protein YutE (UPF0331/DUF86 family) n=1 Tax=Cytobacillus purgationiresistens TaxID=863449 RepID=A0ABU0AK14_9BACI|nr:hypothetical protein [Cytobacillus purgationiresistens]MDQ0271604.1 uncharacterized protein YutE (UPF0331/DUF86 family) [Cytobacillus purgationiresistens]
MDLARYMISEKQRRLPKEDRDIFQVLQNLTIIDPKIARDLKQVKGLVIFRKVVEQVDKLESLNAIRQIIEDHLDHFSIFINV